MKIAVASLALGAFAVATATAAPINYEGELFDGVAAFGTATLPADGNGNDNPESWDWWYFYACQGDNVTVDPDRLSADADLVSATFYAGAGLPADSAPMTSISDSIFNGTSPAGTTFVAGGDDDEDDGFGGPFGDPNYGFTAAASGWYAVVVGNYLGLATGDYQIVVSGNCVPAPASAVALLGLGGLVSRRRR